jgi:alginate O-acetyltransferase complex protein AlgI
MYPLPSQESPFAAQPAWLEMWLLAIAIYAALKLFTWLEAGGRRAPLGLSLGYLIAWPGMDARAFLRGGRPVSPVSIFEVAFAAGKLLVGLALIVTAIAAIRSDLTLLSAWTGMAGIVLALHFGLFHLLSCWWRFRGVDAVPIMHWPIASQSVGEFWSRRWNLAFRDLTHRFVFRPLARRLGGPAALWIGFLLSGLVHDAVISLPARGGYGGPTLFFLLQAAAIAIERSRAGRSAGLGNGAIGWLFTCAALVLPAPLLFHGPFQTRVVVPFLEALGSLVGGLL